MYPPKQALKEELVGLLTADLDTLERAQLATQQGATHEEAKPENDKDTRALEQSYLARGQARRVLELRTQLAQVEGMPIRSFTAESPIALGALVVLEGEDHEQTLFVAPHGGGRSLAEGAVQVVTPEAPLGRALLGKRVGEDCVVLVKGRQRESVVARVE